MNVAMHFFRLILVYLPITINSQEPPPASTKGPGISSCMWYGDIDKLCGISPLPAENIPDECTSVIFSSIVVDNTLHLRMRPKSAVAQLDSLLKCGKQVYIYYSHYAQPAWTQALSCNTCTGGVNAKEETESIKAFFNAHPGIAGFILSSIVPDSIFSEDFPDYSQNLKVYLDVVKSTFPDLGIGIDLMAVPLINYYADPKIEWLDFNIIDPSVDFYILNLYTFLTCTPDMRVGGSAPLTGNSTYTVEKIMSLLEKANVPKSKIYIKYSITTTTADYYSSDPCNLSYTHVCANPGAACDNCADTLATFYEKGKYSKIHAAGFMVDSIDSDDPGSVCQCGHPFPAFFSILDGFNGINTQNPCPLFDRM